LYPGVFADLIVFASEKPFAIAQARRPLAVFPVSAPNGRLDWRGRWPNERWSPARRIH
jgi:hypothetical protein